MQPALDHSRVAANVDDVIDKLGLCAEQPASGAPGDGSPASAAADGPEQKHARPGLPAGASARWPIVYA